MTAIITAATTARFPIPPSAGRVLFFNQHLSCFRCHGGFNFSDATVSESGIRSARSNFTIPAFTIVPGLLSYPAPNVGIYEVHKDSGGRRKIQSAHAAEHRDHRALHARRQYCRHSKACSITTRLAAGLTIIPTKIR